jgi:D-inositol-3-phosphate glycosyltransferase
MVPLVHSAHTLAKVKNRLLAEGDKPEPKARVIGEEQVVAEADRLVANTPTEARELIHMYDAPRDRVEVVEPGVDLDRFTPTDAAGQIAARRRFGLPADGYVIAFIGRIQPLKAPDVLLRAAAELSGLDPVVAAQLTIAIVGGNSGSGLDLTALAGSLGLDGRTGPTVRFLPPQAGDALAEIYRAADIVAVPSYNESFGLVAMEAQACGTPVVAAAVGGLITAVRDERSGVLVDGHRAGDWARVLRDLLAQPERRAILARGAVEHAANYSWSRTASGLLAVYREAMFDHHARVAAQFDMALRDSPVGAAA